MLFYRAKYVKAISPIKKPTWNLLLQWKFWKLMHVNEKNLIFDHSNKNTKYIIISC